MTPPIAAAATVDTTCLPDEKETSPEAPILEHSYDGIQEYDNPMPGWWRAVFWATIVFSAGYWVWYHVGGWGQTPADKYQSALVAYEGKRELRAAAEARNVSEDTLARSSKDGTVLAKGAEIFGTRCASCHDKDGKGLIGPNLTDGYQMHGSTRMDIFKTVRGGVPGTAMLAWGEQMAAGDVIAVAAFVANMRGTNIKGKEPQGAPVEPFK